MKCNKHFTNVCDTWVEFMPSSCLNLLFKFYVCPLLSEGTRVYLISFSVLDLRSAGESSTRRLRAAEPPLTWPKSCDLCVNRPIMRGWREGGERSETLPSDQWKDRKQLLTNENRGLIHALPWPLQTRGGELSSGSLFIKTCKSQDTDPILWNFLIRNQRHLIDYLWRETIPEKRRYSAWNIESQPCDAQKRGDAYFSSKSVLFVGKSLEPGGVNCVVCSYKNTKYKIQNTRLKVKLKIQNLHQHWRNH